MFQSLQDIFKKTFDRLSGQARLTETDVLSAAREIKLALLSADVHFAVVKDFVDGISKKAVGKDVLESITPAQQFTKIVHDELVRVLGGQSQIFDFSCEPPIIVLIAGLQGSGKTTTAARFAIVCKKNGRRPFLVPADVHRPAAIEQLKSPQNPSRRRPKKCTETQHAVAKHSGFIFGVSWARVKYRHRKQEGVRKGF